MTAALIDAPLATHPGTRHLLSSEDLDRASVDRLLELAASFEAVAEREVKKLPTLRGRTVLSVFFEASTRTASSFELAAKRLSADTISLKSSGSSVEKGETLKDTLLTLDAYGPDVVVIRHAQVGAAALATRYTRAAVVNAGDGAHQHPTQSLLDLYAMRAALGRVEGVHVAIVGDVLHSRVARSNLSLLLACGAHVTLVGPPSLIPRGIDFSVFDPAAITPERKNAFRAAHALPANVPLIILPARLSSTKGHELALRALALIRERPFLCLMIGPSEGRTAYRERLLALTQQLNLHDKVRFIDRADIPAAYAVANLVLSPSQKAEGFGRVPVEAQAMGVPVIATALGATSETVLDGETGWLIPVGDAQALAETIVRALSLSPDARRAMADKTSKHVQAQFDVKKMCAATLDLYAGLVSGHRPPASASVS